MTRGNNDKCPLGMLCQVLWRAHVSSQAQSEYFDLTLLEFEGVLPTHGLKHLTLGHNWPIMPLLRQIQVAGRKHGFWMDFSLKELRPQHDTNIHDPAFGDPFKHVVRVVSSGKVYKFMHKGTRRRLIYLVPFFAAYNKYIEKYMRRAESLGIYYLVIYCLDDEAWRICVSIDLDRCVRGGRRSYLNKFGLPLVFLNLGVDVLYLDADTFLMQNPTPTLLRRLRETNTDMLVSASFADACICSGIIYWGATETVRNWLFLLLSWMYEHYRVDDQNILSALLQHGDVENLTHPELLSVELKFQRSFLPSLPKPRWAILDPVVQFAHARALDTTGWTGDWEDMVIFHFLGGQSELNPENRGADWNSRYGYLQDDVSLADIFYGAPHDFYTERDAFLTDEMKAAVYRSWRPERPQVMLNYTQLPEWGLEWLDVTAQASG